MLLLVLSGCTFGGVGNHDPDTFKVMFLSSVPLDYQEPLQSYVEEILSEEIEEGLNVEVIMTMANFDRLTVEIVSREVDMFIVDGWLDKPLLDPYGLLPLDEFYDLVDEETKTNYVVENEEGTGEHLYLVPLNEGTAFYEFTGFKVESGLVTGIVSSTPHEQSARKLLEEWLLGEKSIE